MLSVIIPAYNEEPAVAEATQVVSNVLKENGISFEIIFVDDGSKDGTWQAICRSFAADAAVRGIRFSRNFGKESAIFAGLAEAKGDCTVVIDCDLQHPPEKIVEMYRLWEEGYEIVEGVKSSRGEEGIFHSWAAKIFYAIISRAVEIDMSHASDFKLLDRKAVNVLLNMHEKNAFFRALSSWIGFRTTSVSYDVRERIAGETKWSTKALILYAASNIASFSSLPMQIVTGLGIIIFIIGLAVSAEALYRYAIGTALGGFTTVIILQCLTSSLIMIGLGIIGYYISKIYDEIKGRPRYIVAARTGEEGRIRK